MKPKDYLNRAHEARMQIKQKLDEIETLRSMAEKITAGFDPTAGGSPNARKMENAVMKLVELQEAFAEDIERYAKVEREVIELIDKTGPQYSELLFKRYIKRKTFDRIAKEMHYTRQWVTVLHGRALVRVKDLLEVDNQ